MIFAALIPCLYEASDVAFSPTLDRLFDLPIPSSEYVVPTIHRVRQNTEAEQDQANQVQKQNFLSLPCELRLEIYSYLLLANTSPRYRHVGKAQTSSPEIWTPLLRVNRQIHAEASPILYSQNKWLAHQTLLTSFPRLRTSYKAVTDSSLYPRMRRFHLRVRLDCDPPYEMDTVTRALSGLDELSIETFQAMVGDNGAKYPGILTRLGFLIERTVSWHGVWCLEAI